MKFHTQNLNEKSGDRIGSMARHGRLWWTIFTCQIRLEWSFLKYHSLGLMLDLADYDDDAIGGHLSLGYLGAIYWGLQHRGLRRLFERLTSRDTKPRELDQCASCLLSRETGAHGPRFDGDPRQHAFNPRTYWSTNGRNIGIGYFDGNLWIDLWNDPMEHCSRDPKWWHISINFADVIFGRTSYDESRTVKETRVVVPMPEGGYPAHVRIYEAVWRRSRWPFAWRKLLRADITPDKPIPFPSKGESSYDCGEDATHSMTCCADTPLKAAMALSESVMRSRIKYGSGWNYRPQMSLDNLALEPSHKSTEAP